MSLRLGQVVRLAKPALSLYLLTSFSCCRRRVCVAPHAPCETCSSSQPVIVVLTVIRARKYRECGLSSFFSIVTQVMKFGIQRLPGSSNYTKMVRSVFVSSERWLIDLPTTGMLFYVYLLCRYLSYLSCAVNQFDYSNIYC